MLPSAHMRDTAKRQEFVLKMVVINWEPLFQTAIQCFRNASPKDSDEKI